MKFVGTDTHHVNHAVVNIDGNMTVGLDCIGVEYYLVPVCPIAFMGCTEPTSLLAVMTDIRIVSSRRAESTASGWTKP